ncbi:MAG: tetratricopeptide repeat protein, partial [Bacteroidota bacterium]
MRGKNLIFLSFLCLVQAFSQDTKENADFKLAVNLYNDKLYDLALEQFRQFISLYPNTQNGIEARFYLGLAQSKQGSHEDARVTFQNFALAYPENPKAPDAWWNVAEACIAVNNLREAALAFERVKSFHPKSKQAPAALQKAAELFERLKDRESAKKILRSLTQEYASLEVLPARLKLAEFLTEEAQFDAARNEYKVVADASKDNNLKARALVMMAGSLVNLG